MTFLHCRSLSAFGGWSDVISCRDVNSGENFSRFQNFIALCAAKRKTRHQMSVLQCDFLIL